MRSWGTDLLRESLDKVKFIQEKLLAAQGRQKEYADRKVRDLDFMEGEQVLLKVSPMKGVMCFGKRGNLSPMYIGPFFLYLLASQMPSILYHLKFLSVWGRWPVNWPCLQDCQECTRYFMCLC